MMKNQSKSGLSLIEAMIACLALGIMMIPAFMILKSGNTNTAINKSEILAQNYAANLLNYVIAKQGEENYQIDLNNIESLNGVKIDLGKPDGEYAIDGVKTLNMPINTTGSGGAAKGTVLDEETGYVYALYVVTVNYRVPSNKNKKGTVKMSAMVRRR